MAVFTGKTVDEAIENGLASLGIPRLKAHIKVISREKKGFLGFGRKPAQVDVEVINDQGIEPVRDVEEVATKSVSFETEAIIKDVKEEDFQVVIGDEPLSTFTELAEKDTEVVEAELIKEKSAQEHSAVELKSQMAGIEEAVLAVANYVQSIILEMDVEVGIEATNNRRHINLQIETPDAGRVIGYHGKVLKSLQLLAQNFLHDHYSRHFSVSLNVHDYLEQRTEVLIEFTHKIANRVLETGQSYTMDSMSNGERKIVHKTIAMIEGVTSFSEGDDPNRYVVVTKNIAEFEGE